MNFKLNFDKSWTFFLKTYLIKSVPSFWTSSFAWSRNHPIFRHIHFQIFVTPLFHEFFLWQNSWIHVMPLQDYFSALFTHKNSSNSVFLEKRQIHEFFGRKNPFKDFNASARTKRTVMHITVIWSKPDLTILQYCTNWLLFQSLDLKTRTFQAILGHNWVGSLFRTWQIVVNSAVG